MNSSPHVDNKGRDILILEIGPTQGLGEHFFNCRKNVFYCKEITKFKAKRNYKV